MYWSSENVILAALQHLKKKPLIQHQYLNEGEEVKGQLTSFDIEWTLNAF